MASRIQPGQGEFSVIHILFPSLPSGYILQHPACSLLQDCDSALLRRFERRILVPFPDAASRGAFFTKALSRPEMEHSLHGAEVAEVVCKTEGNGVALS